MVLFYGSKEIVVYPSIRKSIYNRDFYFGFYCTANKSRQKGDCPHGNLFKQRISVYVI